MPGCAGSALEVQKTDRTPIRTTGDRTLSSRDHFERPEVLSRRQMTELAVGTISALQDGGFVDEIDLLCERVFRLAPDRLFDTELTRGTAWTLSYKPMVELLLIHVRDVARTDTPRDERREEIRWAMETAGF
jgi:hypothetical protein